MSIAPRGHSGPLQYHDNWLMFRPQVQLREQRVALAASCRGHEPALRFYDARPRFELITDITVAITLHTVRVKEWDKTTTDPEQDCCLLGFLLQKT